MLFLISFTLDLGTIREIVAELAPDMSKVNHAIAQIITGDQPRNMFNAMYNGRKKNVLTMLSMGGMLSYPSSRYGCGTLLFLFCGSAFIAFGTRDDNDSIEWTFGVAGPGTIM